MIRIELMIESGTKGTSGKVWELDVPIPPKKGDLFCLLEGRELSTPYKVSVVYFEQRDAHQCALVVLVKRRGRG
jgi:hypothetical protein